MEKISIIKRSIGCLYFGAASLIPILGLGPLVVVFLRRRALQRELQGQWNPAGRFVFWGGILAILGFFVNGFLAFAVIVAVIAARW